MNWLRQSITHFVRSLTILASNPDEELANPLMFLWICHFSKLDAGLEVTCVVLRCVIETATNLAGSWVLGIMGVGQTRRVKAIGITYSESVPATLDIQRANRMRHIIMPSVSCLATQHFSHSRNGTIFRKMLWNVKFVFWFFIRIILKHFSREEFSNMLS